MATRARDVALPGKANKSTSSSKSSTVGSGSKPRRKTNTNSPNSSSGSLSKCAPNDVRPTLSTLVPNNPKQQGKKPILGGDPANKPVRRRSFDKPPPPSNAQNIHGPLSPNNRSYSFSGGLSTLSPTSEQSPSSQMSTLSQTTGKSSSSRRATLSPKVGQSPLSGRSAFTPTPGSSSLAKRSMTPMSLKASKEVGKQHASYNKPLNSTKKSSMGVKKKDVRRGSSSFKEQHESLPQEKFDDRNLDDAPEFKIKSQDEEFESKSTIDDKDVADYTDTEDSPKKTEMRSLDGESFVHETEQQSVEIGKNNEGENNNKSRLEAHEEVANNGETKQTKQDEEGKIVPVEPSTMEDMEIPSVKSNIVTKPNNAEESNIASKPKDGDDSNLVTEPNNTNESDTTTELKDINDSDAIPKPVESSTISQTGTDETSTLAEQDDDPQDNINLDQDTTRNATNVNEKEEETTTGSETHDEEVDNVEKKGPEKVLTRSQTQAQVDKKGPEKVLTRSQTQAQVSKQKENVVSNDAIEETAAKLQEQRKNRVRALAGAFESVISLQDSKS